MIPLCRVQEVREMTQLSAKDETWTEEVTVWSCLSCFFPANPMIFIIFRMKSFFIILHHFLSFFITFLNHFSSFFIIFMSFTSIS